jgi:hypothetical protein
VARASRPSMLQQKRRTRRPSHSTAAKKSALEGRCLQRPRGRELQATPLQKSRSAYRRQQAGLLQCIGSLADLVERNAGTDSDIEQVMLAI